MVRPSEAQVSDRLPPSLPMLELDRLLPPLISRVHPTLCSVDASQAAPEEVVESHRREGHAGRGGPEAMARRLGDGYDKRDEPWDDSEEPTRNVSKGASYCTHYT